MGNETGEKNPIHHWSYGWARKKICIIITVLKLNSVAQQMSCKTQIEYVIREHSINRTFMIEKHRFYSFECVSVITIVIDSRPMAHSYWLRISALFRFRMHSIYLYLDSKFLYFIYFVFCWNNEKKGKVPTKHDNEECKINIGADCSWGRTTKPTKQIKRIIILFNVHFSQSFRLVFFGSYMLLCGV